MKHTHATITGTVISLVFVLIGFGAILAAVIAAPLVSLPYTVSLIIFLIVLWVLMLYVLHNREPSPAERQSSRRR